MKYLGIDYGSKRIGLAVGDDVNKIAFPREVVENQGESTLRYIAMFCEREKIEAIVLGQSLNFKNEANPIQTDIEKWKVKIGNLTNLPVYYQSEVLTSSQAARNTPKASLDAAAAALILQGYLDRN